MTAPRVQRIYDESRSVQAAQRGLDDVLRYCQRLEQRIHTLESLTPVEGRVQTDGTGGVTLLGNSRGVRKVTIEGADIRVWFSKPFETIRYRVYLTWNDDDAAQILQVVHTASRDYFDIDIELSTSSSIASAASNALDYSFMVREAVLSDG